MNEIIVHFSGNSAERGQLASDLNDQLTGIDQLSSEIRRESSRTQDAGTLLSIALAGPAVVALVKGIADWLVRRNQSHVTIELPNGERVSLRNMASEDVSSAIQALQKVVG